MRSPDPELAAVALSEGSLGVPAPVEDDDPEEDVDPEADVDPEEFAG